MALYSLILTIHHIKEFMRLCDGEGKVNNVVRKSSGSQELFYTYKYMNQKLFISNRSSTR